MSILIISSPVPHSCKVPRKLHLLLGTVRANCKHIPLLKTDKQVKLSQYECLACKTLSAAKCMDNKSAILLSNYHGPGIVKEIDKWVRGSKDKVKV